MRVGQSTTAGGRRTRAGRTAPTAAQAGTAATLSGESAPTHIPAPVVLDRYRLVRRLGTGGFGTVWLARDERLQRDVAVKILPRQLVLAGRFEREAHAAARLAHPGIVTLYEAAADDEGAYLVSELVRGTTLERALVAGRLSDRAIMSIGVALCDALDHAHANGIVHRDVKPSNILIPAHGSAPGQTAKLTDFGVARVVGGDTLTRTGELVGTAGYMAPEQAEGREAGVAADLYSLALVLYEALTGVNPVPLAARSTAGQRTRRLALRLPPLRRQRRELPRELGQAIDLALRPAPRERGSVAELRAALVLASERVDDTPGVVAAPRFSRAPRTEPQSTEPRTLRDGPARSVPQPAPDAPGLAPATPRAPLSVRGLGALAGAGMAAWIATHLLHPAPLPAASAALLAAIALVLLPRLGWLALIVAATAALGAQGRTGAALVLGVAALLPVLGLARAPGTWPLAAIAPALGAVGLAGAWPALAAAASQPWRRAMLGALGWIWISLGGALAGRDLYVRRPPGLPGLSAWESSVSHTTHHVLGPLVAAGLPAGAALWALAAVALPWVRSRRSGRRDAVGVGAWALALAIGTGAALRLGAGAAVVPSDRLLVAGALAAALAALAPRGVARIVSRREQASARPRLA